MSSDVGTSESLEKVLEAKKIKYLNVDNSWNKSGILSLYDNVNDTMVLCTDTKKQLFFIKNGKRYQLESFGYCAINGKPYHIDRLKLPNDVEKAKYPVECIGAYSLDEFKKPLTKEEQAEIWAEHRI